MFSKKGLVMKKTRNPEAVCGNCPYVDSEGGRFVCCRYAPMPRLSDEDEGDLDVRWRAQWGCVNPEFWCGDHPDFFVEAD